MNSYVTGGRNPNTQRTCGSPECVFLISDNKIGGWCSHSNNRVPPSKAWPNGYMPSVSYTGGCDFHLTGKEAAQGDEKLKPFRIWGPGEFALSQPRYKTAQAAHDALPEYARSVGQSWLIFTVYEDLPNGDSRLA